MLLCFCCLISSPLLSVVCVAPHRFYCALGILSVMYLCYVFVSWVACAHTVVLECGIRTRLALSPTGFGMYRCGVCKKGTNYYEGNEQRGERVARKKKTGMLLLFFAKPSRSKRLISPHPSSIPLECRGTEESGCSCPVTHSDTLLPRKT